MTAAPDFRALCAELVDALDNLLALVNGECPSLLDGDRGGSGFLDIEIDDALTTARAMLAQPAPETPAEALAARPLLEPPTDEELMALAVTVFENPFATDKDYARAVLERWGK